MSSDVAFIGVMVGTWSGPRALCFMDGNQAEQPAGRERQGENECVHDTSLSWAFQSSLIRWRRGELACLHVLGFILFVICRNRASRSSHPLSKKHSRWMVPKMCNIDGEGSDRGKKKTKNKRQYHLKEVMLQKKTI